MSSRSPADASVVETDEIITHRPLLLVARVGAVIGLAIMGDSLMYGILPLAAPALGLTPQQVGLLLSANRLVRLGSNTWVSGIFARLGPRGPFLAAAVLGTVTAGLYGIGWGFGIFLMARLAWGVAWSGLRQGGYQAVWTGSHGRAGQLMGVLWGIIRGGSAVSVLIGGYLFDRYGYGSAVGAITGLTALGILVAWTVRWPAAAHAAEKRDQSRGISFWASWRAAVVDPVQRMVIAVGALKLLLDAVLVATASLYLAEHVRVGATLASFGMGVGTVAGIVLAVRGRSDLVVGPLVGLLSDRVGQVPLATLLLSLLLGLLSLSLALTGLPSLLAFLPVLILSTGVNVTLDAAANRIALRAPSPQRFIGVYTTFSDGGSALGPLLALPLVTTVGFAPVYLPVGLVLWTVLIWFWRTHRLSSSR